MQTDLVFWRPAVLLARYRVTGTLTLLVTGLLALTLIPAQAQPYTFITWAGNVGWGTADGTNSQAQFDYPQGITMDGAGNLYIADSSNGVIRKAQPSGGDWIVSTWAGTPWGGGSADGTNASAQFNFPGGVAADKSGNVYVLDSDNYTIRKITPEGVVTTLAGMARKWGTADGTNSNARFDEAYGIAVDDAGNIYVADSYNYTIRKVSPVGTNWVVTTLAGVAGVHGSTDGTNNNALFDFPTGLALDAAGNIYVADAGNNLIRKMTLVGTDWVVTTVAGTPDVSGGADGTNSAALFDSPEAIALDAAGNLYVVDAYNNTIRKITPDGTNWVVTTLAGLAGEWGSADGLGADARFDYPTSLTVDSSGNIYVVDAENNTIRKLAQAGTNWVVSTVMGVASIGSVDAAGRLAQFYNPYGLAVDGTGNVFVADSYNNTVRKITPTGVVSTLAGLPRVSGGANGMNSDARFNFPWGVAVDGAGNVYVTDYDNHTIRKLIPTGADWLVTTLAGSPGVIGSNDGTTGEALFYSPAGVAVDDAGNVYITDTRNHTIRWISPAGIVSTIAGSPGSPGMADGANNNARFHSPLGIALDQAGNLFVSDYGNQVIRKITHAGSDWIVSTLAGSPGTYGTADGTNSAARFAFHQGIAVDDAGSLYVADSSNNTIRKVTPVGTDWVVTTLGQPPGSAPDIGDGTGSDAQFDYPRGIAVDKAGNLYVADTDNNTIRKGIPASAAPPRLELHAAGDQVRLTWPLSAAGFVLETAGALSPAAAWLPRTNGISISGESFSRTEPRNSGPAFYRLHKPSVSVDPAGLSIAR